MRVLCHIHHYSDQSHSGPVSCRNCVELVMVQLVKANCGVLQLATFSLQTSGAVCAIDGDFDNLCAVGRLGSCVWCSYPKKGGK